MLLNSEVTKA